MSEEDKYVKRAKRIEKRLKNYSVNSENLVNKFSTEIQNNFVWVTHRAVRFQNCLKTDTMSVNFHTVKFIVQQDLF